MEKTREFWIITWKIDCYDSAISNEKINDDDIHVIEYSAYKSLKQEFAELCLKNERLERDWKKMREVLELIATYKSWCGPSPELAFKLAKEALSQLETERE
jgi:hypothetical protein